MIEKFSEYSKSVIINKHVCVCVHANVHACICVCAYVCTAVKVSSSNLSLMPSVFCTAVPLMKGLPWAIANLSLHCRWLVTGGLQAIPLAGHRVNQSYFIDTLIYSTCISCLHETGVRTATHNSFNGQCGYLCVCVYGGEILAVT